MKSVVASPGTVLRICGLSRYLAVNPAPPIKNGSDVVKYALSNLFCRVINGSYTPFTPVSGLVTSTVAAAASVNVSVVMSVLKIFLINSRSSIVKLSLPPLILSSRIFIALSVLPKSPRFSSLLAPNFAKIFAIFFPDYFPSSI